MNQRTVLVVVAALSLVVGCGKKDKEQGGGGARAKAKIDVAAVNALVPEALKDKIVFEQRDLVIERGKSKTTYTLAAPKDWTQDGKMFASLKADDKGGFFTSMEVGSSCGGMCSKGKDWAVVSDQEQFSNRAKDKIIKDDKGKGRRAMISEVQDGTHIVTVTVAWWTDEGEKYHRCTADLDPSVKDAAPAFEKACSAVNIDGDD